MEDIYFQIYDEDDNLVAEIQVFDDMNSWVITDSGHKVIVSVNNDECIDCYEEEFNPDIMEELYNEKLEEDNDNLIDGMLDYLDKHNRNTNY